MHKAKVIWTLLKMKISQLSPLSFIQLMLVLSFMLSQKHVNAPWSFLQMFWRPSSPEQTHSSRSAPEAPGGALLSPFWNSASQGGISSSLFPFPSLKGLGKVTQGTICSHCIFLCLKQGVGGQVDAFPICFSSSSWERMMGCKEVRKEGQRKNRLLLSPHCLFYSRRQVRLGKISPSCHRPGLCSDRHQCCRSCSQTEIMRLGKKWFLHPGLLVWRGQSYKKLWSLCTASWR